MTTEQRAARVLAGMGTVCNISTFGHALLEAGVMQPCSPKKRHSRQGLALLAGKWLRRLQREGLAVETMDGWRATFEMRPPNRQQTAGL